jgi:tetratricopeptide (TPR) repeat protein
MNTKEQLYDQGFNFFAKGMLDEAVAEYKKAIELEPQFAMAYMALSMAYEKKGLFDDAIETVKKAIELDPEDPLLHTSLSKFYQRKGMIPEAEKEKAIAAGLQRKW